MTTIFDTIKSVAFEIDNAIKTSDLGYSNSENSSGEDQLKLDVQSDIIIEKAFASVAMVKNLVSEEKEGVLELNAEGRYTICYDPLDGSSLVDVNLSIIFGDKPKNGSSTINNFGIPIKPLAIASICCSPPDIVCAS